MTQLTHIKIVVVPCRNDAREMHVEVYQHGKAVIRHHVPRAVVEDMQEKTLRPVRQDGVSPEVAVEAVLEFFGERLLDTLRRIEGREPTVDEAVELGVLAIALQSVELLEGEAPPSTLH